MSKDIILEQLKEEIAGIKAGAKIDRVGTVIRASDGVAEIKGLGGAMYAELLEFEGAENVSGMALNLEEHSIKAIILGDTTKVHEGQTVKSTGTILSIPVSEKLVGRVLDPLGNPKDGGPTLSKEGVSRYPLEKIAPGVITREGVKVPIHTGWKAIDGMIPIGRGQRELIIGDRQTGKTAIAVDAIVNQQGQGMKCIYVAISQKESKVARIVAELEQRGALAYTTVVLAGASTPASLSYIAPYAGCAMGEYFMDKGEDVLVVYDDLSKHAVAYRQISLLLRRPPGREAYPGDVFYLHSRLLERAAKLNKNYGGGSLTALPIIETQAGDVSAYIPTNVISITDGQIFLETDLFYQGIRPALNVGISVSRVGSSAQIKAMKQVAGKMKLDFAQYRELAAFAQFGSDLDEETKKKLERGKRLTEIFKQGQYAPVPVANQVLIFFAANEGLLDDLPVNKIREFEQGLYKYADAHAKAVLSEIAKTGELNDKIIEKMKKLIIKYKEGFMTD